MSISSSPRSAGPSETSNRCPSWRPSGSSRLMSAAGGACSSISPSSPTSATPGSSRPSPPSTRSTSCGGSESRRTWWCAARSQRSRTTSARRSRCSPASRWRRSSRPATCLTSTRCPLSSRPRAWMTSSCASTSVWTRPPPDLSRWEDITRRASEAEEPVRIALVGKYVQLEDAYLSVVEALKHAGTHHGAKVEIDWVDSEAVGDPAVTRRLEQAGGILIPGGFGGRGIEGKIRAAQVAREHGIPYLGICLGMQIAVAEFARHMAGMEGANSTEFDPETPFPVIDLLPEQKEMADMGGTMRLGADPIKLHDDTRIRELYGEAVVYERHRHRYEVNNHLRRKLRVGWACAARAPLPTTGWSRRSSWIPPSIPSSWPRSTTPSSSPAPNVPRRCSTPSWELRWPTPGVRSRCPTSAGETEVLRRPRCGRPHPPREAHHRGRAQPAGRDVRHALPDREPVGSGEALHRLGQGRARGPGAGRRGGRRGSRGWDPDAGNLLARVPGQDGHSVLICAHLDTVPLTAPIEPVVVNGGWENANEGFWEPTTRRRWPWLSSWPAASPMVTRHPRSGWSFSSPSARRWLYGAPRPLTPAGCTARSAMCSITPPPSGKSFSPHPPTTGSWPMSGVVPPTPESGPRRAAARSRRRREPSRRCRLGRLDPETTANVGTIRGGTNANVVAEHCHLEAEVRSLAEGRAEELATELVDHLQEAANAGECDLDVTVERMFEGYRTRASRAAGHPGRAGAAGLRV